MNFNSLVRVFLIVVLLIMSGFFYRQNISYKLANKKLMLQNDSLLSVNIELTRKLDDIRRNAVSGSAGVSK